MDFLFAPFKGIKGFPFKGFSNIASLSIFHFGAKIPPPSEISGSASADERII